MRRIIRLTESDVRNIVRNVISESLNELDLYHGSMADFDEFDLAYISSGWGQQAYGYGIYLTDSTDCAKSYSRGGLVYTAKVPNGPYLSYVKISPNKAYKIANDFYKYYLTQNEYGKEAYIGHEKDFWELECSAICNATDGGQLYGTIASILGDDKETSEFLYKEGFKGIKWIDNITTGKKNTNYLIFNPKDIQIIKKEKMPNHEET